MPSRLPAPDTIVWSAPCVRAPDDDRELFKTYVEVCREGEKFVVVAHYYGARHRDSKRAMKLDRAMAHAVWLSRGAHGPNGAWAAATPAIVAAELARVREALP